MQRNIGGDLMIKKVFRPLWSYDLIKTENWLSLMAEKGYHLVEINRHTRMFSFKRSEPKSVTYRIGYDQGQVAYIPKALTNDGWMKVYQSKCWHVVVNEKPQEAIKTFPTRNGVIQRYYKITTIYSVIVIYFGITALINVSIFIATYFANFPVTREPSPLWIITYTVASLASLHLVFSLYSLIKLKKEIKKLEERSIVAGEYPSTTAFETEELELEQVKKDYIKKRKLRWDLAPDQLGKWLEAKEKLGINLCHVKTRGITFHFKRGRPRRIKYCVDYQNRVDEHYFSMHQEAGWKLVYKSKGWLNNWAIWAQEYSDNATIPLLYSDQTNRLKHARRILMRNTCLHLPMVIMFSFILKTHIQFNAQSNSGIYDMFGITIFVINILLYGSLTLKTWLYYNRMRKSR